VGAFVRSPLQGSCIRGQQRTNLCKPVTWHGWCAHIKPESKSKFCVFESHFWKTIHDAWFWMMMLSTECTIFRLAVTWMAGSECLEPIVWFGWSARLCKSLNLISLGYRNWRIRCEAPESKDLRAHSGWICKVFCWTDNLAQGSYFK
jgi:hypothetical protein